MEVSGSSSAPAPATVSLEQQLYKAEVAQIRAGNLKDSEKQMQIKKLTHEVMLNLMKSEVSAPTPVPITESIQKFGKIVGGLPLALVLRVMSFIERLSLNDANGIRHKFTPDTLYFNPITSSEFLVLVRECLTKKEKAKLNELLALFVTDPKRPADDEIERCFAAMGVDFKKACLEEIIRAIQDRTLSKQDVEITARVIKKDLALLDGGRDFEFTKFTEENYEEEFGKDLKRASTLKDDITRLDFSHERIKVVPNILAEFTNLSCLDFTSCTSLIAPPDLRHIEKLKYLNFTSCTSLIAPPDLRHNQTLTGLSFDLCTSLSAPPDLSHNPALRQLSFDRCTSLTTPPDLRGNPALKVLSFKGCTSLSAPPDLRNNPVLTELSFDRCQSLTTPPDLRGNPALKVLSFKGCTSLTTPPDLSYNQTLTWLFFNDCTSLTELPDLSHSPTLRTLSFKGCTNLETPPDLRGNRALEVLCFTGCSRLTTPPDLSTLTNIRILLV